MSSRWISKRAQAIDSSGIRKVFDLAAKLADPVNLSIGQPDFPVPEPIQQAATQAIRDGFNGYTPTQGTGPLREKLAARIAADFGTTDRSLLVTSGTSGAIVLALMAVVDPGDEVIVFDPYFVMYPALVRLAGGVTVYVDTYPDYRIDIDRVRAAITPRTKAILFNSPANPTGAMAGDEETKALAELAAERDLLLVSDEIYRLFSYERPLVSPALFNPQTLVIDGFSKTYGMTGWRVGWTHGPAELIDQMTKLQQYTFVCAPHAFQLGGLAALDVDMSEHVAAYRRKRDLLVEGIRDLYDVVVPGGAFYAFIRTPWGTCAVVVRRAIENKLLIYPGGIFSQQDTHFRISYAATDETIARGVEILRGLAKP